MNKYAWRLPAQAALRWAVKAQRVIEQRISAIENDQGHRQEYLDAKLTWQALRNAEVKIKDALQGYR